MAALLAEPPGPAAEDAAARELLDDVLGPEPGPRAIFHSETKRHHWANDNAGLLALILSFIGALGVYFATAVFKTSGSRKADNVGSRRAFCWDIDAGPDKVAKHGDKVYADRQAALAGLVRALKLLGIVPAWIIASGPHGLHVYFVLTESVTLADWLPVAAKLKRAAKLAGLLADDAVTADAARVLRPLGTLHHSGHVVSVLKRMPKAYTLAEFEALIDAALLKLGGGAEVIPLPLLPRTPGQPGSMRPANAQFFEQPEFEVTDHTMVELASALAYLAAQGYGGSYGEWVNKVGQALKSLAGTPWEDAARHLWLDFSRACPKFKGDDAALAKWRELGGDYSGPRAIFRLAYDHGWPGLPQPRVDAGPGPTSGGTVQAATDGEAQPTDLALAELWVRKEVGRFGHEHTRGTWVHHFGGAWRYCDKEQQVESFKGMAGLLLRDAAAMLHKAGSNVAEVSKAKRFIACAIRAQSANGTRAALSLAQASPAMAMTFDQFDQDPDLLNVANGVVHLPTGELRPHDPALMLHRQSPVAYETGAPCPAFAGFLEQVSAGDPEWVDNLQRALGYCLSGYVHEERAFFWLGIGANGKSVLGNLVRYVLGTYAASAPSTFLMQSRRDAGSATPELAMLPGVRLLMANEVEAGSRLSAHMLKVATSTEHIAARPLYGHPMSFKPTHKTIIRGNHRPVIVDDDEGIWRRIDLVPFELKLRPEDRDGGLEARLMREAPGILAWMVRGFALWRERGLKQCRRVREASLAYRKDSDLLGQWVEDACDVGQGFEVPQRHAYGQFRQWCQDQGLRQPSKKTFTRGLHERGVGERRESTGARAELYTGIRLKS
jgi:putative DNA primase/helicase